MRTMSVRAGAVAIAASAAVLVAGTTGGGAAGQGERLRAFFGRPAFLDHVRTRRFRSSGHKFLLAAGSSPRCRVPPARATSRPAPALGSSSARTCRRRASTSPT